MEWSIRNYPGCMDFMVDFCGFFWISVVWRCRQTRISVDFSGFLWISLISVNFLDFFSDFSGFLAGLYEISTSFRTPRVRQRVYTLLVHGMVPTVYNEVN